MICHILGRIHWYISDTLSSDLSPKQQWEVGIVLEDEKIYEEYEKRFSLKFQDLYSYQVWSVFGGHWVLASVRVREKES